MRYSADKSAAGDYALEMELKAEVFVIRQRLLAAYSGSTLKSQTNVFSLHN